MRQSSTSTCGCSGLHAFVLWLEHEPVMDADSQERIRAALGRLQI